MLLSIVSDARMIDSIDCRKNRTAMLRDNERGFSLIELMMSVAIIGILITIALPQYQSYQVRARVAESLVVVEPVKRAIEDYYVERKDWPWNNEEAGLSEAEDLATDFVEQMSIQPCGSSACGQITLVLSDDTKLGGLAHSKMYFAPKVTEGTIAWTCHIDNVESHGDLVPKECRNEKPGGDTAPGGDTPPEGDPSPVCPDGYKLHSGKCKAESVCPDGTPPSSGTCESGKPMCPDGKSAKSGKSAKCKSEKPMCPDGYKLKSGKCELKIVCPDGKSVKSDKSAKCKS
ncbi:MAG TPA: prepilin-type N-terminal cleavage/methylation domain-containing protein [Gammaproteobacteria bacterium]|nr:prepilin-type N-terminal cleavage/methylation domain-containing protein [Gammaproteobacteria bacterium]